MLELRNVRFRYPESSKPVLESLSFKLEQDRVGLIGANGCGKTTMLHLLVGLLTPECGELCYQNQVIKTSKDLRNLRREVGFLFQNSDDQLFSPTVIEDVAFGPLNLGHPPQEARAIAEETLASLGLHGFEERITYKMSGGEKKLVALATILSMNPRVLLLDEPTNSLDPGTRERLIDILGGLKQQQLIISHDWDFLRKTTSALYLVEHGQVHRCEDNHLHSPVHKAGDRQHHHDNRASGNGFIFRNQWK